MQKVRSNGRRSSDAQLLGRLAPSLGQVLTNAPDVQLALGALFDRVMTIIPRNFDVCVNTFGPRVRSR